MNNLYSILIVMTIASATIVAQNHFHTPPPQAMSLVSGQNNVISTDSLYIKKSNFSFINQLQDIGVPYDSITAVTFDGDGRIWIGSKNGLWIFDGSQFREYTYKDGLLAQMNPHFIFNSLNSVQRYILANDKESAHNYLQKFASMMRKVLENSSQSTITLSEEIATLELYLQLESLRFDNGFDYEITVQDKDILQFEIPTMLLHTFVENAVWHGLMNKEGRGIINLRFSKINKKLILCEIEDNRIGRKKAEEYKSKDRIRYRSKGIEIVKKRIELLNLKVRQKITCETIDLEGKNTHQTGTLVRLEIPVTLA